MNKSGSKRRVLLVTNAIPPVMTADSQRARMLADTLPETGWETELLVPNADFQIPIHRDAKATTLRPEGIQVHEAAPGVDWLLRAAGMKSMSWRAVWPLYRLGCEVFQKRTFDLVYITTAQFNFFLLGSLWYRKFGMPYILDFHDPWFNKTNHYQTTPRNWKYYVTTKLAKPLERFALKHAAGLIAVSPVYLEQLRNRYPTFRCVEPKRSSTIPFGVSENDFSIAQTSAVQPEAKDSNILNIVYVGGGRTVMAKSFRRICQGLSRIKQCEPELVRRVRIQLLGTYTYWKAGDPKELESLAESEGVGDLVEEQPARIGYVDALGLALRADGLLVLGVDDPAYMPSKLFLYAMTGKPLLACMHPTSQVNDYFLRFPELGTLIHYDSSSGTAATEDPLVLNFLRQVAARKTFERENIRANFSAAAMARQHAKLFEQCVQNDLNRQKQRCLGGTL